MTQLSLKEIAERLGGTVSRKVTYTKMKRKGAGTLVEFDHRPMMNDVMLKLKIAFPDSKPLYALDTKSIVISDEKELVYLKIKWASLFAEKFCCIFIV